MVAKVKLRHVKLELSYIPGTLYVTGIKRLEDEEKDRQLAGIAPRSAEARALKIAMRIQTSANRCVWFSSTELGVYIQTGDTFWTTHADQPLFLPRSHFMLHECVRILEDRSPGILEAAQVPIQIIGFAPKKSCDGRDDHCTLQAPRVTEVIDKQLSATNAKNESAIPPLVSSGTSMPDSVDHNDAEDLFGNLDLLPDVPQDAEDGGDVEVETAEDEEEDQNENKDDNWEPSCLHETISRFDDWLHRGPFLQPLTYHLYIIHITRVRKPKKHRVSQMRNRFFDFDAHYPLSDLYVQKIADGDAIARLVGAKCPQYEEQDGEAFAHWHTALYTTPRCPGPGHCANPLMFKHLLQRDSTKSLKHRFAPAWRARIAQLKLQATDAEQKADNAQRIMTLDDTTVVRPWTRFSGIANDTTPLPIHDALRRVTVGQIVVQKFEAFPANIFVTICQHLSIETGFHKNQLHLEEFAQSTHV